MARWLAHIALHYERRNEYGRRKNEKEDDEKDEGRID